MTLRGSVLLESEPRIPSSAGDWRKVIERTASHRCDLDVLLKDEWRHRIPVRDVPDAFGPTVEQALVLDIHGWQTLEHSVGSDDRLKLEHLNLAAVALMVFHRVLDAYGHGSTTAIGFVNAIGASDLYGGRLLPTLVDHADLNDTTCIAAVEAIERSLRHYEHIDPGSLLRRGLFDAVLVLADDDPLKDAPPLPLAVVIRVDGTTGRMSWKMSYATALFEHRVMQGVLEVVRALFEELLHRPTQLVADVELVTEAQRRQLDAWNATEGEFPAETRLEELIENAVRRTPDAEALRFGDVSLTYQQLNERCNRFAHWLLGPAASVRPDELIGLFLDKSDLPVVITIGIWKAGSACVPIDPSYPADRVRLVVRDTGVTRIVTNRHHAARLREMLADHHRPAVDILVVESIFESASTASADDPRLPLGSARPAYVMYTSGTTGIPKGVVKQHRSVVNSITDLSKRYRVRGQPGDERIAQLAGYVFEPFMRQMLLALINSHVLVVVPDDLRLDPHRFSAFMARHRITYLNGTGSVLQHYDLRRCRSLRRVALVGEELTAAGLRLFREKFDGHVINEYAFTESAFVTAIKEFGPGVVERTDRSIGRPLRNVTWYVLDNHLKLVPIGAIGELYVGGLGVANGYLNRPELSAERFLANPFRTERERQRGENGILYRTGDLARMLPSGEVEFMGRSDFQLKLNGIRVEPGEIEARATEFPGVQKCVVVARGGIHGAFDRRLVGYFVAAPSSGITEAEMLKYLEERLIPVMVPARMVRLPSFPINAVGKVDWRALPGVTPTGSAVRSAASVTASGDTVLETLRDIWSDLLGVPATTIHARDDFFRLGGQSISCILLIARVRERLRRVVNVEEVFRLRSFGAIAEYIGRQPEVAPVENEEAVAVPLSDGRSVKLPANGLQQGLVYHALKRQPGDDAYVIQSVYRYRCAIRPDLLKKAWTQALRTYPSLRLRFELHEEPLQVVDADLPPLDWRFIDLTDVEEARAQEARIQALQRRDRAEPYEIEEGRLFRLHLIKQREDLYGLLFSCHHIILDGWSLPVLHDYVHRTYLRLVRGDKVERATDTAYLAAQRYWEAHRGDHVEYWTEQVERIGERGDLSGLVNARNRYQVELREYSRVREHRTRKLYLGTELTEALKAACTAHQLTLHSALQFVWHEVLHAIGGGRTTVVGTIVSGRNLPIAGIEHSVGLFINTLPIVVDHDVQSRQTVAAAAANIQAATNAINSRSTVDLGGLRSGGMKGRLFDTLLVLENYPRLLDVAEERDHREQLRFEHSYDIDKVDHPLAVVAREEGSELVLNLWYAGELFDEDAIDTLLDTAQVLFEQVADDIAQPVGGLELFSPDKLAIFDAWNETHADFAHNATLHRVFEEAADRWPDEIAVIFRDTRLTYRALNERANRVAHRLRSTVPVRPDDLFAIVMDKSEQMIVAILAVWKAGAAYVPIDPDYPDERVTFMLEETQAQLVIADEAHGERLRALVGIGRRVLEIQRMQLDDQPPHNPVTSTSSTNLAYAIYTSGTTGRPKAVLVEHRGVVNLQASLASLFSLSRADGSESFLSFSNYVFDHFVEQMTDALLNGQTLVVLDDELRTDNRRLCQYINDHGVTYLSGTPSVLTMYDFSSATSLTRVDAIGEDFTAPAFNTIRRTFGGTIINGYGPTEISITSHKRPYIPAEARTNKSIGFPVANTTCYVLDREMRRVPVGGIGELFIGGVGVTRGYLRREDLTAERFVDNPFRTPGDERRGTNARLYRTGDLVRWLPNGELEYLGRNDQQVKIRGHRVELSEIETMLSSHPDVRRSVVVARELPDTADTDTAPREKYLAGFYLSDCDLTEQDLVRWMRTKLPAPLVPARIVPIDEVPVTASGKLDVRRLPPTDVTAGGSLEYVAPSTELETDLCGVWSRVLGVHPGRIGVHDDFFSLGGDSLRAIRLASSVTKNLGRILCLPAVFQYTTVKSQARHLEEWETTADGSEMSAAGIAACEYGDPPVSSAQERLVFIEEFLGGTDAYNIPFALKLTADEVTNDALTGGLRTLLRRHPALRTLLRGERDGVRLQSVLGEDEAVAMFEVRERTVGSTAELDAALLDKAGHVFHLDSELPIRAGIYQIARESGTRYLGVVVHHSCFDGWSMGIFRRELAKLADGATEAQLPPLPASYADFAVWRRRRLTGVRLASLTEFWSGNLEGFEPLDLPIDRPRPPQFDHRGREVLFDLDAETTAELKALAKAARVSLYSVLLGATYLMLQTYTGQHDIVVGTPSANRGRPEFDGVVGLFANLLVLRTRVDDASTIANYLRSVGDAVVQAHVHQELPFEQLVTLLDVQPDASRHPIVQTLVTLTQDNTSNEHSSAALTGAAMSEYRPDAGGWTTAKFDLSVTLTEVADRLAGIVTYSASLFEPASVAGFVATFQQIAREFARLRTAAETATVSDVRRLDDITRAEVLGAHQAPGSERPPCNREERTLHSLFEHVAARSSGEIAVAYGTTELTYRDLNERANQLAHDLLATGVRPNDLVALVMGKSERMIVAIVAVWKAGAAYVPIDPSYPDERVVFMLDDTRARMVLADGAHYDRLRRLSAGAQPVVNVEQPVNSRRRGNPVTSVSDSNIAYAIYTSGTSGMPKAVLVKHRNVVSFRDDLTSRYFCHTDGSRQSVLFLSSFVFDFSIEQLVLSILSGHKLVVPPPSPVFDDEFYEDLNTHGLTYLSGTPTQIDLFDLSRLKHLRLLLVAGEKFKLHHHEKVRREYSGPLLNAYGTTETTVYNTVRRFEPGDDYRNALGDPLSNTRLYVLDHNLQPVPTGAIGGLFIAGECVSAGYLRRPELTCERFVPNPFLTEDQRADSRWPMLYKTGDVVRRRTDGELEFLGRNDSQVKINGLRVELGEVEAALASFPGVRQCAVIPREGGRTRLIGYYMPDGATTVDEGEVVDHLRARLLPAMVPAMLVRVDQPLPITINGKLDTASLPPIDDASALAQYAAPRSRLELRLCRIWGDVLRTDAAIGLDDDFFRRGGDSIAALQLASRLQRELGRKIGVKLVFEHPTVRGFVDQALKAAPDLLPREEDLPRTGACSLSPVQEWFFAKPLSNRNHWNQHFAIRTPPLVQDRLRESIARLAGHHDAFRLRFRVHESGAGQQIEQFYDKDVSKVALHILDVRELDDEKVQRQLEDWQSGFDIEHGPLCCAAYLYGFEDGTARVWLAMHHLIVDVVSWRIIAQDLEILYHGGDLGPHGTSYGEWVAALRAYQPAAGEVDFWEEVAARVGAGTPAPPSAVAGAQCNSERLTLSEAETAKLLAACTQAGADRFEDLLLTAVGVALQTVTGDAINYVTVEAHGREAFDGAPDVGNTVGWFTTMHPIAVEVSDDLDHSIRLTSARRGRVPHRGIGYGAIRGAYGTEGAPLPPTSFNYLGRFDGAITSTVAPHEAVRWQLDAEMCGTSRAPADAMAANSTLDVTVRLVGDRLIVDVDSRLRATDTHRFVTELRSRLKEMSASGSTGGQDTTPAAKRRAAPAATPYSEEFDPYIVVSGQECGPVLFVLPPGEGGAESYLNNIARELPGISLVLFNNVHLHQPAGSFEEVARYHIAMIRDLQPDGPYSFLGWSFGGVLAFEIALQLARAGQDIANLILIDSFFGVRRAASEIGLSSVDSVIDPINERYVPDADDLTRLDARTGRLLLFKATRPSQRASRVEQSQLFEYYANSPYNNLDTLLPPASITVETLPDETHFSWVANASLVASMSARIRALVQPRHETVTVGRADASGVCND